MKKITLFFMSLFLTIGAMAQNSLYVSETLPGTLTGDQYTWKSEKLTAPEGDFNKLRVTFMQNTNNAWNAGFPMVCIAEFYLYDKDGNVVTLTVDRFTSNATHVGEGSLNKICDGNTTKQEGEGNNDWYWHSQWQGTPQPYGFHYLEIDVAGLDADLSEYSIGWVTRYQNASPTEVIISAGATTADACKNANSMLLPKLSTPNSFKIYTIRSSRSTNNLKYTYNNTKPVQTNALETNCYWYFTEGADGKVLMHNVATEQVLGNNCSMAETGEWYISPAVYLPGVTIAQNENGVNDCIDDQSGTIGFWNHTANDNKGTTWFIIEVNLDFAVEELQNKKILSIGEPVTEVAVDKWYILNNVGRSNYVSQELKNWKMRASNNIAEGQLAKDKAGYLFKITKNGEFYNLMSGNGKYFKLGSNSASTSETAVNFSITKIGTATDQYCIFDKENGYAADGQASGNNFVGWSSTVPTTAGGNDSYRLLPVEFEDGAEYVYDYYLDGTKVASETLVSAEFEDLGDYYCVSSENIPTGTATRGAYRVDITDNLPFEYSNSLENATNWYFFSMHCNYPTYIQDNGSDTIAYVADNSVADDSTRYRYAWAFVGDPINGFKVINNVTRKAITSNGDGDATTTDDIANARKWLVKASSERPNDINYFTLRYSADGNYLNANAPNGKIQHWQDPDGGSTINLSEVADVYTFEITDEAENVHSGEFTYRGNEDYLVINGAYGHSLADIDFNIADRKYIANIDFPFPVSKAGETPNETMLAIWSNDRYLRAEGTNIRVATTTNKVLDLNALWAIYPSFENNTFKFTIKNIATGKYIYSEAADNTDITQTEGTVILSEVASEFVLPTDRDLRFADRANLYLSINGSADTNVLLGVHNKVHGGTNISAPEAIYNVTISDAGYATFYASNAVSIPENVKAYYITENGINQGWVELTEIAGTVIPANTGVILEAEAGTYAFNKTANVEQIADNKLLGTVENEMISGEAYVLGLLDGKAGLGKAKLTDNQFLNNHHKAYLPKTTGMNSASLRFDFGGTTAIEEMTEQRAESKAIFDLTGRRVNGITKAGVYIVNGKKVLVK